MESPKLTLVLLRAKRSGRIKAFKAEHAARILGMADSGGWEKVERKEPTQAQNQDTEHNDSHADRTGNKRKSKKSSKKVDQVPRGMDAGTDQVSR